MPTNSKARKKTAVKSVQNSTPWYKQLISTARTNIDAYLARRPHRSFKRTYRRDYIRPLVLPKFTSFTLEVTRTLWKYKKIFLPLMVIYLVLYAILVGVGSQETYSQLSSLVKESSASVADGVGGVVAQTGITLYTLAMNGLNTDFTDVQQIFGILMSVLAWLTTVWLLRNILAGHKVTMRDGLYNAGAPLIPAILIVLVIAVQLLPVAVAAVGYAAAVSSGLIEGGGVEAMLFWAAAALLALLSLYWITSTLFALIIVTLPGMYPYQAIKTAGDIVLGRRIQILLRWVWMFLCVVILWIVLMSPIILLDMGLKSVWPQISWIPIVPVALLFVSAYTIFWVSTYVYLLYRKVVENESA